MEKQTEQKVSFSFKLPAAINQKMNEAIVAEGYGLRGKSRWIRDAVESFLNLEDFIELTNLSENVERNPCSITVRLPRDLMIKIEQTIISIRQVYPAIEGVKSKIVRASIYQRILRNYK